MRAQLPASAFIGPDFPWLAPLAGFSDLPFRLLCRERGAAAACTEMVSAKGLVYGLRRKKGLDTGTGDLLLTRPEDSPLAVQLFGAEADFVGAAAAELRDRGYAYFDLNMGCSVPKVVKQGAGAALLREPGKALAVAGALFRAAGEGRAGCKLRLGWDAGSAVYLDLAKALEDAGAAWISLHPRYAKQGFSGAADRGAFEKLAARLSVPLIASGDLFSAEDALECLERGASGVMFARGALHNPDIFGRYAALRRGERPSAVPSAAGVREVLCRHAALARELTPGRPGRSGLPRALLKMRTVAPRYVRHLPGARALRLALGSCESWDDLDRIFREFFNASDDAQETACG